MNHSAADRPHGTVTRYQHGPDQDGRLGRGCRCEPCRNAAAVRLRGYRRQWAHDLWNPQNTLQARSDRAREHLRGLLAAGLTVHQLVGITGVSRRSFNHMIRTNGPVYARIAQAVLAVEMPPAKVDPIVMVRRARALARIGYPFTEQARMLGLAYRRYMDLIDGNRGRVSPSVAEAQATLYDRLAFAPLPVGKFAVRARHRAIRLGWPSPAAWDDDTIADPMAQPQGIEPSSQPDQSVDWTAVHLAIDGRLGWRYLHEPERMALVNRLLVNGWSISRIARRFGLSGSVVKAAVARLETLSTVDTAA